MKPVYNDRAIRLECLKLAALLTSQLKMKHDGTVAVAQQFLNFIKAGDADEGVSDDEQYPDEQLETPPPKSTFGQTSGSYSLRDLRRRG